MSSSEEAVPLRAILVGFLILLSAPATGAAQESNAKPATATVGRLGFVTGEVRVDLKPAIDGHMLRIGSIVETGKGRCVVMLGKETVLRLGEESRLKITHYLLSTGRAEEATLDLDYGKAGALVRKRDDVRKKFLIRSRGVTMGVRGTHIYIETPKDPSLPQRFATLAGVAELSFRSAGKTVEPISVRENEQVQVQAQAQVQGGTAKRGFSKIARIDRERAMEIAAATGSPAPADWKSPLAFDSRPDAPLEQFPRDPVATLFPKPGGVPLDPVADGGVLTGVRVRGTVVKK